MLGKPRHLPRLRTAGTPRASSALRAAPRRHCPGTTRLGSFSGLYTSQYPVAGTRQSRDPPAPGYRVCKGHCAGRGTPHHSGQSLQGVPSALTWQEIASSFVPPEVPPRSLRLHPARSGGQRPRWRLRPCCLRPNRSRRLRPSARPGSLRSGKALSPLASPLCLWDSYQLFNCYSEAPDCNARFGSLWQPAAAWPGWLRRAASRADSRSERQRPSSAALLRHPGHQRKSQQAALSLA